MRDPAKADVTADDETIVLSPFIVSADEDAGSYTATSTLAGSRVRTDLKDIASSLSVITADFMKDTGIRNNQDLLVYTTNTEVGGPTGNYAGVGNTFVDGANESANFLRPNQNTRVRGLDSADNTRDLFATDIPWDGYNVGRVDLQRGPNSILFGIGSPAGIINTSLNTATYKNGGNIESRLGSYGSARFSLDYNRVLLPNELSVRVAALDDNTQYRQRPASNHDRRVFGAVRWEPKLFSGNGSQTSIRVNFENGDIKANRPRVLPPSDRITPFFDPGALNKQTLDPYFAWSSGIVPISSIALAAEVTRNYWIVQAMGPGLQMVVNPAFVYDSQNATSPAYTKAAGLSTYWGVGLRRDASGNILRDADGNTLTYRQGSIGGFPFGSNIGIGSYNQMTIQRWRVLGDAGGFPGADKGFYKDKALTDRSIFDFYNNLIDGPNKREWNRWNAYNIVLDQTFLDNRVGLELAYDRQSSQEGQERNIDSPYISVDIRKNLSDYPEALGNAVPNPYAGRAFIGYSAKHGGNSSNDIERESIRVTAFGEVKADDFMGRSLLSSILGHHRITGLYASDSYERTSRNWVRYAVDGSWSDVGGRGGDGNPAHTDLGSNAGGLTNGDVVIDMITYLSGDLRGRDSAHGLNLGRITAVQSPTGTYVIPYYDSHWNAPSTVDPAAYWHNPAVSSLPSQGTDPATPGQGGTADTQNNNPANYVGWINGSFAVNSADNGGLTRLLTDTSKVRKETKSTGFVLQSYLWDDTIVGTAGWRRDEQRQRAGGSTAAGQTGGVAQFDPVLDAFDPVTGISKGNSTSWGVVAHTPKFIRKKLPWGADISLTYSDGRNTRVENRYGFDGAVLPNAKGRTKDIGVAVNLLDDRLVFKVTHYQTEVSDANLSSVTTQVSTLGNGTEWLMKLEAWGTASAIFDLAGRAGAAPGLEWYWNWAMIAGEPGGAHSWEASYWDPTPNGTDASRARFNEHPQTVSQTAAINSWLSQMQPQEWFNAYGFPVDVARARAGDWQGAIAGFNPVSGIGGVQPANGGRINGSWPTGTANNQSKGWEFEVTGTPVKGLNLSINASKQFASQTSLGQSLARFVEAQHQKYLSPAGDLRLWWGGDQTVRAYYEQNVWSGYQFQLRSNGRLVPEMSPWRANLVANYAFQSAGWLKGVNVGVGYRWQDRHIIGYGIKQFTDPNNQAISYNLDIDKPYWSSTEDAVDAWIGYERKLSKKLGWRIQLNTRNLGESAHLVPISVQPDGSPAGFRIADGFSWTVTNTFSF